MVTATATASSGPRWPGWAAAAGYNPLGLLPHGAALSSAPGSVPPLS